MQENTWWNIIKYIGNVIFVLVEIFIVLHIVDYYQYSDNRIIIFILILIYTSVKSIAYGLVLFMSNQLSFIGSENIKIRELILKEKLEEDWSEIKKINSNNKQLQYKFSIKSVGLFIIQIISIFTLLIPILNN